MAVHGTIDVDYPTLAEGLGLVRAARRRILDDPPLAEQRLDELEQLLEDLMARLEEHRA
jgi:hypothetical protein